MKAITRNNKDTFTFIGRPFLKKDAGNTWKILYPDYEGTVADIKRLNARRADLPWWQKTVLYSFYTESNLGITPEEVRKLPRDPYLYWGMYFCVEPPAYREAWRITEQILVRLDSEVQTAGAQLVVFTVPALIETDTASMKKFLRNVRNLFKATNRKGTLCLESAPANRRLKKCLRDTVSPLLTCCPPSDRRYGKRGAICSAPSKTSTGIPKGIHWLHRRFMHFYYKKNCCPYWIYPRAFSPSHISLDKPPSSFSEALNFWVCFLSHCLNASSISPATSGNR